MTNAEGDSMAIRSIRRQVAHGLIGATLAVLAAGSGSVALAAEHTVDISGFAFAPRELTVKIGDTVTWANADAQSHTATADDGAFDSGSIGGNASKSVTLTTAGTFAYHCRIHPQMTATLVVAAATPPPTDTAPADVGAEADSRLLAAVLVLAALGGVALARRRFVGAPEA
jgi:plastocyanin